MGVFALFSPCFFATATVFCGKQYRTRKKLQSGVEPPHSKKTAGGAPTE
jgi:hypothetical protein